MPRTARHADTPTGPARIGRNFNEGDTAAGPGDLMQAIQAFINDLLGLLALEAQLAIVSLIVMLAAGTVAAVLVVSVWLLVLAAVAVKLVAFGWPWAGVLLCVAAANSILVAVCALLIRRLSHNLLFAATRRSLRPGDDTPYPHDPKTDWS